MKRADGKNLAAARRGHRADKDILDTAVIAAAFGGHDAQTGLGGRTIERCRFVAGACLMDVQGARVIRAISRIQHVTCRQQVSVHAKSLKSFAN